MRTAAKTVLVAVSLASAVWAGGVKPRVSLELLTRPGLPLMASQQWFKVLTDLGVSGLQIHAGGPRDEVAITQQGSKASPEYRVVGILAADNSLYLPGGKFSLTDSGRLRKWLDELGDQGAAGVTEKRSAFGLIARQLEQVNADLKKPVGFSTKGMSGVKAVSQVAARLDFPLVLDEEAKRELTGVKVAEELSGISSGTALAVMLRPAGLVLEPVRPQGGELQYRVGKAQADHQAWPVGWKPEAKAVKVLPDLFEFLNVEIKDTPVSEALEAIEGRLKIPFLFDHNALALYGIDPTQVQADVPSKRLTYTQILNKVLMQAKLKYELRLDEADKPFLWITTVKPVPQEQGGIGGYGLEWRAQRGRDNFWRGIMRFVRRRRA
ncbi:MAG: hypothetical protein HY288_20325 [Planctomycetia bacterium]|nr:hypothetical protein [Planctomycetia bacterium]